jgi:hypothetical protein
MHPGRSRSCRRVGSRVPTATRRSIPGPKRVFSEGAPGREDRTFGLTMINSKTCESFKAVTE